MIRIALRRAKTRRDLVTVHQILTTHHKLTPAEASTIDSPCGTAAAKLFRAENHGAEPIRIPARIRGHDTTICAYTPDQVPTVLPAIAEAVERFRWKLLRAKAANLSAVITALIQLPEDAPNPA